MARSTASASAKRWSCNGRLGTVDLTVVGFIFQPYIYFGSTEN